MTSVELTQHNIKEIDLNIKDNEEGDEEFILTTIPTNTNTSSIKQNLRFRIALMNFLQFYIWGSWITTMATWWFDTQQWSTEQFGLCFSTMGISACIFPTLTGIIADRWLSANKLYLIYHFCSGCLLLLMANTNNSMTFFWLMLIEMCFYMPTISLAITISYNALNQAELCLIQEYPRLRVWGTIGFVVAMWVCSVLKLETSSMMFISGALASGVLTLYSFTLPLCPCRNTTRGESWISVLGLDAFRLFTNPQMAIFFIFCMLLGACLQLTNAYADVFLHSFADNPEYANKLVLYFIHICFNILVCQE